MRIESERQGRIEIGGLDPVDHLFASIEDEAARKPVRATDTRHDCDGCGEVTPDVDLWAEDDETGEELWLCLACGDR